MTYDLIPIPNKSLVKIFPYVNFKFIFLNPYNIASFFKHKDLLPSLLKSGVVYSFVCPRCNLGTYVGSTRRMLKVRADGHRGVSHRTKMVLTNPESSSIRDHCNTCCHIIDYQDFNIISSAKSHL
jgi:hypothetical protein